MLKRFEVTNFKGFESTLVFDLAARDYSFNSHLVNCDIVNKAIVYGKNGVGKSSLGIAIFDAVLHLTDKERMPSIYLGNYCNLNHPTTPVLFRYVFQFDSDEIIYEYSKMSADYLIRESISINGETCIDYDYFNAEHNYVDPRIAGSLNIDLADNKLSVVKFIYRNTPTNSDSALTKMMRFF